MTNSEVSARSQLLTICVIHQGPFASWSFSLMAHSKLRVTDGYVIKSSSTHPLRSLWASGELSSVTMATAALSWWLSLLSLTWKFCKIRPEYKSLSVVVFICNNVLLSLAACVLSSESGSALSPDSGRAGTGTCYQRVVRETRDGAGFTGCTPVACTLHYWPRGRDDT